MMVRSTAIPIPFRPIVSRTALHQPKDSGYIHTLSNLISPSQPSKTGLLPCFGYVHSTTSLYPLAAIKPRSHSTYPSILAHGLPTEWPGRSTPVEFLNRRI